MSIIKPVKPISAFANDPETERNFRAACKLYEGQCSASGQPLSLEHQEYLNHYHQITSLYLTWAEANNKTKLIIYDTESESEEVKILDTPKSLNWGTCATQLPNGDLFCYGVYPKDGIALIIDRNLGIRVLPSGIPCFYSSVIYFNNNVYCFGGMDSDGRIFDLSRKFDLNENRWINLTASPEKDSPYLTVISNGNILVTGWHDRYLLLYSVDIDSFSTIPYEFTEKTRKVLVNVDSLYVIECGKNGFIYESQDEYNWNKISESRTDIIGPCLIYSVYNKEAIYIVKYYVDIKVYKFDLSQKVVLPIYERALF